MISIIVPVYNEEENVGKLHARIYEAMQKIGEAFEIIFIDDGSSDLTYQNLKKLSPLTVIRFRRNFGQTSAIDAGIKNANGDIIVTMDGDLQNDPADIPRLVAKLREGYDVVSGWRQERHDSLSRRIFSRLANWLTWKIGKLYLHDHGCSFKAYIKEILEGVNLYGEMHVFLAAYLYGLGARVTEIPVSHSKRSSGFSKSNIIRAIKANADLLTIRFISTLQRPMVTFGGFGFLSFGLGILAVIAAIFFKFKGGLNFSQTPLPVVAMLFFLTGFLLFIVGFISELFIRVYYESRHAKPYIIKEIVKNLSQK